jgi:hypothetical protein
VIHDFVEHERRIRAYLDGGSGNAQQGEAKFFLHGVQSGLEVTDFALASRRMFTQALLRDTISAPGQSETPHVMCWSNAMRGD